MSRPLRVSDCTCRAYAPDPDCRIDHQGIACDRAEHAERKLKDAKWLRERSGELDELTDLDVWQAFVANNPIEFMRRLRAGFERIAESESEDEIDELGRVL